MINVFVARNNIYTFQRLLHTAPLLRRLVRPIRYDLLFARRVVPRGTCIFTDFDLLSTFEIDAAARAARAAAAEGATILNWPHLATERFELLNRLYGMGLNPIEVTRIDEGRMPTRFPVFIRCEDGSSGPETELLADEAAYRAALVALREAGKTPKRRIAVSFEASPDPDGLFRKYGAFVIGDRVVPQHILRTRHWNVKLDGNQTCKKVCDEEFAYVRDNPHAAELLRLARACNIDYGRVDYAIRDGSIVVFEINTNPNFPRFVPSDDPRAARLPMLLDRLVEALQAVDGPTEGWPVPFELTETPGRGGTAVVRARWFEDLPFSLLSRRRWHDLVDMVRRGPLASR